MNERKKHAWLVVALPTKPPNWISTAPTWPISSNEQNKGLQSWME
jgi:hypothetical protein